MFDIVCLGANNKFDSMRLFNSCVAVYEVLETVN